MHVSAADLRTHRRAARPDHMLVLLLDHTCHHGWDWYAPLTPYLGWAYVARAAIGVVEIGAATATNELRAERFRARSLLDPRVAEALERAPGRATPLAHGLSLAAQMLRHDTQQDCATVSEAVLLVLTDGRANVPLAARYDTDMPERVGREGLDDAMDAARMIKALHRVRSIVISPGPRPYGHLTMMLAEALGGQVTQGAPAGVPDAS
jgi:magnesium chelatase subunit D